MKIERIQIGAFGRLTDLDSGPTPLDSLVVVVGPNEAGKSTLFRFLTTALYGFHPASRDRNPHVPWGAEEAGGEVHLRLDGGSCARAERRLRSTAWGRLTVDGHARDLRNQPLPWVEHIPRSVFRQVFAVTLADLAGLDEETWARIQDRVLGSMGAADLRPARVVAETLEKEAAEIWRPSRRGNQRLRDLQEEIRALRARRTGALERDRSIRALIGERENLDVRLGEMRGERQRDRVTVERVQELLPLKRQVDRIQALRVEGGERAALRDLPDDPKGRLASLEADSERLGRKVAALDRDLAEPMEVQARFDATARSILARRDRIAPFLTRVESLEPDRLRVTELRNELSELEHRRRDAVNQILSGPCDEAVQGAISALSLDLLKDRISRLGRRAGEHPRASRALIGSWRPAALFGALGVGLVGWGLFGGPAGALIVGAASLAVGSTLGLLRLQTARAAPPDPMTESTATLGGLQAQVVSMLTGIPVREEYLQPPGDAVASGLERIQRLLHDEREMTGALRRASERLAALDVAAAEIATELGEHAPVDARTLSLHLDRALREAERTRDAAASAAREQARLGREREAVVAETATVQDLTLALRERLDAFRQPADPTGLETAQRRLEAHARADRIEEELERAHSTVRDIQQRLLDVEQQASWSVTEDELARTRVRIDEYETEIETLIARTQALDRDAAHLREMETVDAVDSEVASLQETESQLAFERDRKWLLARLVREADRRFREEHQPDLLRRASSYLEHLTGGRYDRLFIDEDGDADLFQIVGPGIPAPIPLASPISTGTLEQAYLSLRLAIVDHLDQGNERLPLFIDEAFVNWDDERRDRGLEVLGRISASRQVFAFTCHPEMATRLEGLGGRVLRLDRDS